MRMMLGTSDTDPILLINADEHLATSPAFDFWVINGAWEGTFTFTGDQVGTVYIRYTKEYQHDIRILTTNQDRLRGDYQDVFSNFGNVDYIAPESVAPRRASDYDDDIPF